jgi:hypothetical protein
MFDVHKGNRVFGGVKRFFVLPNDVRLESETSQEILHRPVRSPSAVAQGH